ncbi:MAG: hypothetical protein IT447_03185 [Phycisphaerales bacterium]|jgi:hypothetical protein|nr:hypothetical protein [Phycisphaerales bacterium]
MSTPIDHSVYPDLDRPPSELESAEAKADYIHRICSAWDFGIQPEPATFNLFSQWREVFDRFPIVTSPAYHTFRSWFGWPSVPIPTGLPKPTLRWEHLDRLEGRPPDPCDGMI